MISILLPVFNAEAFLTDCIQSILNQSYTEWELIAINDHSTDHSLSILSAFAQKDTRIKFYTNPSKGIISALRLAFKESQGQFISRMDADDLMAPDKLLLMQQALSEKGLGYVCTALVKYFSAKPLGNGYQKYQDWLNQLSLHQTNFSEIYKECVIPSPCWMIHRQDLIDCGAFVPNDYPEDYDLCFRFYEQKMKLLSVPKVLHFWRDYPTRTSRTDERYAKPQFLEIKIRYFLRIDYDSSRPLFLWGAGRKGKFLAKILQAQQIPFYWISNNKQKTGKHIYNVLLQSFDFLQNIENPQIIIAIAGATGQKEVLKFLKVHNFLPIHHYYFFS